MKKKVLLLVAIFLIIITVFSGCSAKQGSAFDDDKNTGLISIENEKALAYRQDTKVVYILFSETFGYQGYGYLSPYISENGKFCRYINDEIVEISD